MLEHNEHYMQSLMLSKGIATSFNSPIVMMPGSGFAGMFMGLDVIIVIMLVRKARKLAEQENVEVRLYEVIYNVLEDVNNALVGMLKPEYEEVVTGEAEVREVFGVPRVGKVAGCFVTHGTITRGSKVRFLRDGTVIWKGTIASLRRFKDDVREVREGFECGLTLSGYNDIRIGDVVETFELREIPRS